MKKNILKGLLIGACIISTTPFKANAADRILTDDEIRSQLIAKYGKNEYRKMRENGTYNQYVKKLTQIASAPEVTSVIKIMTPADDIVKTLSTISKIAEMDKTTGEKIINAVCKF